MIDSLRHTLAKMEMALGTINDAIIWTDTNGTIQWCNEVFDRIVGRRKINILGKNLFDLLSLEETNNVQPMNILLKAPSRSTHYFISRQMENLTLEIFVTRAHLAESDTTMIFVIRDVSEMKKAEREIAEEANAMLTQRNLELQAVVKDLESFSFSVSHDLRGPIRHIDGFSQMLFEDYSDKLDEKGKRYLQLIRKSTQHMGKLIDDLLNLSQVSRSELRKEEVDMSKIALAVAEDLRNGQPKRSVHFVIENHVLANGDEGLLTILIENLIGNAFKFTSKHPKSEIRFGKVLMDEEEVYFVKDDGAGFDMIYAHKLYGAFQRLHGTEDFDGNGIGLATVHRIIHRHGGKLWAEGAVEKGATFYFTIPKGDEK